MPMRALRRNQKQLWYCLYNSNVPVYDRDSNGDIIYDTMPDGTSVPRDSGTTMAGYSTGVSFMANLSANKGTSENEMFGTLIDYTKVIVSCDTDLPIDENSIIFETEPTGTIRKEDANYEVKRVASSINVFAMAVQTIPKNS